MNFKDSISYAEKEDQEDQLSHFRQKFFYPKDSLDKKIIYFCGNSLGLQPKSVPELIKNELELWGEKGVLGQHIRWVDFHERLAKPSANIVGAKPSEVVIMNALTVNIHLLLVSFYHPQKKRFKVIIEKDAFPSDQYAIESQISFHGYNKKEALVEIAPRDGRKVLDEKDILDAIELHGDSIALIYLGGVNYYTGQVFDMESITSLGKKHGATIGFNLAHCAGNIELELHDWGVDFASWCTYKYLCAGPGSPAGVFIHEDHHDWKGPRFAGWWGHDKNTRFKMPAEFSPIKTAEGWQISNAPIMGMIPLMASLELYEKAGMENIRNKGIRLTGYLEFLIKIDLPEVSIITPNNKGSQLSISIKKGRQVFDRLIEEGLICDWREPDVIRLAPHPLFNTFQEVFNTVKLIRDVLNE